MNELIAVLKIVLANSYALAGKAQSYHWNIEGSNFGEYHEFFGSVYSDAYGQIDRLAEYIRIRGEYAPISIPDILKAQTISDDVALQISARSMFTNLQNDNQILIDSYNKLFQAATAANDQAIANYAADRLDAHNKQAWFIRSYLKG